MTSRYTPENIQSLEENEIFVFGSNTIGKHGKGAAKTAMKFGAKYGIGAGLVGKTYGIPTKGSDMRVALKIHKIKPYVDDFIEFAKNNPQYVFLVTEIGCGLAGYSHKEIAPLFKDAIDLQNVVLPEKFARLIQ